MKKLMLLLVAVLSFTIAKAAGEKSCYIYSQRVFESMAEYKSAVAKLDAATKEAQAKSKDMMEDAKNMFNEYQQYESRMTNAQREKYKKMIIDTEREANEYEERMFGEDGEIATMQKELMAPIERKVMAAVKSYAEKNGYDYVYDMSLVKVTVYQKESLDKTEDIINLVKNYYK